MPDHALQGRSRTRAGIVAALAVVVSVPTALAAAAAEAPAGRTSAHAAASASQFLNSLGVNVHLRYGGTRYTDPTAVLGALQTLGITHVRENFAPGSAREAATVPTLSAAGVRFDFVMPRPNEPGGADVASSVQEVARTFGSATELIEGANEYDQGRRPGWAAALRTQQSDLAAAVAGSGLPGVPVVGPSLINWKLRTDAPALGDLGSAVDIANIHSYPGGQMPELGVDDQLAGYASIGGGTRVVATETGYHNATANSHRPAHPSTTERTAALYYPRLFLEYFQRGISRTYAYELFDEGTSSDQEDHFGLFRADGSPKGAAIAIGNLTSILADSGRGRTDDLTYAVSDTADTAVAGKLSSVLLEKSDGSFYLALWRQVSEAKPGIGSAAPVDVSPPAAPATITLGEPVAAAQSYLPSVGPDPIDQWQKPGALTVPVGGDVTLLRIVPTSSAASPAPTTTDPSTLAPSASTPGDSSPGWPSVGGDPGAGSSTTTRDTTAGLATGDAAAGASPGPTDPATGDPTGDPTEPAPATGAGSPKASNGSGDPAASGDSAGSARFTDALPALSLPLPGHRLRTVELIEQARRLVAPPTAVALTGVRFSIDGTACPSGVLDPSVLKPGTHTVTMVGRMPDGRLVSSEQIVRTGRAASSGATALVVTLLLALLAMQLAGGAFWKASRVRHRRAVS